MSATRGGGDGQSHSCLPRIGRTFPHLQARCMSVPAHHGACCHSRAPNLRDESSTLGPTTSACLPWRCCMTLVDRATQEIPDRISLSAAMSMPNVPEGRLMRSREYLLCPSQEICLILEPRRCDPGQTGKDHPRSEQAGESVHGVMGTCQWGLQA